ncbi:hypothetical protein Tco_0737804 [Tanacetum coccineum]
MANTNTRLNIEKLDGNIVQKHEGSKQVGFKQLGPGVETGVHGVHDEKRVWFEVELQGAQGDREAEVFQVSNDDTAVAQRRLEDKQPEEKTNTDCLVKEQEKEYQTGWKIKMGNVLDFKKSEYGLVKENDVTSLSKVRCFLIQSGLSKVLWAEDTTMSTYLVNRSPSSAIGFKTPIDMLGFFGWLAIKQGMLEPVKVKCIFLGYHMGFMKERNTRNFIGSGVGSGIQCRCFKEMCLRWGTTGYGHTFEGATLCMGTIQYREDSNETAFAVAAVGKIYAHESLTFNNTVACEVISKWKAELKDDMDARSDAEIWATKDLLDKEKENILGMEIVKDQSGNTLRVSQSRFYNRKLVQTFLEGHSILSLKGSLSEDCNVEKNGKWSCIYEVGSQEYQMVCTRHGIALVDVDQSQATYMTLTEDAKETIWLKGLAIESGFELKMAAGIATGALSKALEILKRATASPALLRFGKSPMAKELRITDSPFLLSNGDEDGDQVDEAAEKFIMRFYNGLRGEA